MATWGDQTCQRFEATAVGFETGFSRLRVRPSNRYTIAPHPMLHPSTKWSSLVQACEKEPAPSQLSVTIGVKCNVNYVAKLFVKVIIKYFRVAREQFCVVGTLYTLLKLIVSDSLM